MRFIVRRMMICIKERYFRFNRITLLAIGLWPYRQSSTLVRLQLLLFFGILMTYVTFQVYLYFRLYFALFYSLQSINEIKEQFCLVTNIFLTYLLLQLIRLLLLVRSFEFIVEILSILTFFIFLLIKYLSFLINMETVS